MQRECEQRILGAFPEANLVYNMRKIENSERGFRDTFQCELMVYRVKTSDSCRDLVHHGVSSMFCESEDAARAEAAAHFLWIREQNALYRATDWRKG